MRSNHRFFTLALAAVAMASVACENQEARRRAEISQELKDTAATLTTLTLGTVSPGTEAANEREQKLQRIISGLGALRDAEGGQKTARSLMSASAHRELAALALAEAALLETQLSRDRTVVGARLHAALRLGNLAAARRGTDLGSSHDDLADHRGAAESQRRDNSERMAQLDGPIGELTDDNSNDREQIDRLADEANRLRREAAQLGSADGFGRFEQAVGREREADHYEYRVAMREMDLDYELVPEHELAQVRFEGAQQRIAAIDRSEENLRRFAEATAEDADISRQRADVFVDEIATLVAALDTSIDGESDEENSLAGLYDVALDHLQRSASEARTAAGASSGDAATPAKLAGARAQALRGRAYWSQARGLTDHLGLLDAMIEAEALSGADTAGFRERRDVIATQRDEAILAAKAAYTEAEEGLGGVSGRGNQDAVLAFTNSVKIALAGLDGETLDLPLSIGGGGGDFDATPAMPAERGGGPASHEALIEILVNLDPTQFSAEMNSYVRATTRQGRGFLAASKKFEDAVMSQFGDDIKSQMGGGIGGGLGMPTQAFRDIRLESEDDDSAVYSAEGMMAGMRGEFTVRRFDDGWFIEFESFGGGNPQMTQMLATLTQTFNDLAKRITAGDFATAEELQAAIMQAMMGAAGGAGGAGGGPGSGAGGAGGRPGGRRPPGVSPQ